MLSVKTVANRALRYRTVSQVGEGPVCVVFHASSEYNELVVFGQSCQEQLSVWPYVDLFGLIIVVD